MYQYGLSPYRRLQGDENEIVPAEPGRNDARGVVGEGYIPACLKVCEEERHGFRKAENIVDALDGELSFFRQVFGIAVEGEYELSIDDMDKK